MTPRTVIVPLILPRLSDKAAAGLVELLHQFARLIEHHYADQIHRQRKREPAPPRPPPTPSDHPF